MVAYSDRCIQYVRLELCMFYKRNIGEGGSYSPLQYQTISVSWWESTAFKGDEGANIIGHSCYSP